MLPSTISRIFRRFQLKNQHKIRSCYSQSQHKILNQRRRVRQAPFHSHWNFQRCQPKKTEKITGVLVTVQNEEKCVIHSPKKKETIYKTHRPLLR